MAIQKRNYFDDDESDTPSAGKEGKKAGAMLPRSVLNGKTVEVGDRITLEVTSIHDDELAVAYASEDKPKDDAAKPEAEQEPGEGAMPPEGMGMGEGEPEEADLYA